MGNWNRALLIEGSAPVACPDVPHDTVLPCHPEYVSAPWGATPHVPEPVNDPRQD